jgi:hypothetical protein
VFLVERCAFVVALETQPENIQDGVFVYRDVSVQGLLWLMRTLGSPPGILTAALHRRLAVSPRERGASRPLASAVAFCRSHLYSQCSLELTSFPVSSNKQH